MNSIEFSIGGFFGGYKLVKIWTSNDKYYKSFSWLMQDKEFEKEITKDEFESIVKDLGSLGISAWDEYYNAPILDGTQWSLSITSVNGEVLERAGSNNYPDNFDELLDVICKYVLELDEDGKSEE